MATVGQPHETSRPALLQLVTDAILIIGDFSYFTLRTLSWMLTRRLSPNTLLPVCYRIGVLSVPVIAITGSFIGMVMAVQFYSQFHQMGIASSLGSIINISIVRELGPVLAATMLAGRIGSAMSAELATMRISEQVDALSCLGTHPLHYLVVPRFLACVLLIPLLTVLADAMGILGGAFICTRVYAVEAYYYWEKTQGFVTFWDVSQGLIKSVFFGGMIGLISCYAGLNSEAGAEGVGRAATRAFVASFVVILMLDLFLGMLLLSLHDLLWPNSVSRSFI